METFTLYALVDPESGRARYVGRTQFRPEWRLDRHTKQNAASGAALKAWLTDLRARGLAPQMVEIETCGDWEEMVYLEQFWIDRYRINGCDLLNTAGTNRQGKSAEMAIWSAREAFVPQSPAITHDEADEIMVPASWLMLAA